MLEGLVVFLKTYSSSTRQALQYWEPGIALLTYIVLPQWLYCTVY